MDIQIETNVSGIPCVCKVLHANYTKPDPRADSDWDYRGGWELDWQVCDRNGRPAPWLQRKLSNADASRIRSELIRALDNQ